MSIFELLVGSIENMRFPTASAVQIAVSKGYDLELLEPCFIAIQQGLMDAHAKQAQALK